MADQHDYADPGDLAEQEASLDEEDDVVIDQSDLEVDDADRWEQATPVPGDDEDYPEG